MTTSIILLALTVLSISLRGELSEVEQSVSSIEEQTSPIDKGLTVPKHLELQWKNKHTLPTSLRIKNPFLEDVKIFTSNINGNVGYPGLEIECYDPDSKSWRLPMHLSGSFAGKDVTISHGEHKVFSIADGFWWFVTDRLPEITSEKSIRIRLVYSFGSVFLRSEEFEWTLKANKAQVLKR